MEEITDITRLGRPVVPPRVPAGPERPTSGRDEPAEAWADGPAFMPTPQPVWPRVWPGL
jgi:hypothetical protein